MLCISQCHCYVGYMTFTMNIDNAEISILCYAKVVYGDVAILLSCHDGLQYGLSITITITITSSYGGR